MKKKNNDTIKLLPIIVFSFVIGGIITLSILRWTPILDQVIGNRNTVITKNGTQIYEKSSLAASVEKVYDAVVVVEGYQRDQLASTGTGFVYKTDDKYGYLLTNQHVISGQEKINVLCTNGREVETELLGIKYLLDNRQEVYNSIYAEEYEILAEEYSIFQDSQKKINSFKWKLAFIFLIVVNATIGNLTYFFNNLILKHFKQSI